MSFARRNGVDLYFETQGDGEPVLLLPGLGMTSATWAVIADEMARSAFVITTDPRGAGRSSAPDHRYSGSELAADACSVLDAAGVRSAHIVGVSMGGMIAQHLALRHQGSVRSLSLISTYASADDWSRRVWHLRRALLDEVSAARQAELTMLLLSSPGTLRRTPTILDPLEEILAERPADPVGYRRQMEFCATHDTSELLGSIAIPTLVLCGSEDLLISPWQGRDLADLIESSQYQCFDAASHLLVAEHANELLEVLKAFILGAGTLARIGPART